MKFQKRFLLRGAVLLFAFTVLSGSTATSQNLADQSSRLEIGKGVVTDGVEKDSEAARAGLQLGDTLLSWTRGDAQGNIESPFDLLEIEVEQAPRGAVTIEGLRGTEKRAWVLVPSSWGLHVRANLPDGRSRSA